MTYHSQRPRPSLSPHVLLENVITGAIKRNTSDLELRLGKTKVRKQGVCSLFLFKITKKN